MPSRQTLVLGGGEDVIASDTCVELCFTVFVDLYRWSCVKLSKVNPLNKLGKVNPLNEHSTV